MSKSLMWSLSDSREINARCLYNEDAHAYEILVNSPLSAHSCRSEDIPAPLDPIWAMTEEDFRRSMDVADRLITQVAQDLGDH